MSKNTNDNQEIVVGLIKGRHPLPVDEYIFNSDIEDVHNYTEINQHISKFICEHVGIEAGTGQPLNINEYGDYPIFVGKKPLIVYVTGLTPVTAELIRICAYNGVSLSLMNFDISTGKYQRQDIF